MGVLVRFAGPRRPKLAGAREGRGGAATLRGSSRGEGDLQVWLCGGRFRDPAPSPARIWVLPGNDFHSSPRRSSPCPPREPPRCPDTEPAKEGQCDRSPPTPCVLHTSRASRVRCSPPAGAAWGALSPLDCRRPYLHYSWSAASGFCLSVTLLLTSLLMCVQTAASTRAGPNVMTPSTNLDA